MSGELAAVIVAAIAAVASIVSAAVSSGTRRRTNEVRDQLHPPNGMRVGLMVAECWQALAAHIGDDEAHAGGRGVRLPEHMREHVERERAEQKRRRVWP